MTVSSTGQMAPNARARLLDRRGRGGVGEAQETLAAIAEARPGDGRDPCFKQQLVLKRPRGPAGGGVQTGVALEGGVDVDEAVVVWPAIVGQQHFGDTEPFIDQREEQVITVDAAINRFLGIAWIGFTINLLSGTALFCMQATMYVKDGTFLLKMLFVLLGAVVAAFLQVALNRNSASWGAAAPGGIKALAALSIVFWTAGMVTGRLIAYLV